MSQPPHIVLIHSDQHRFDCLAAHGHPLVNTPNLDRLAAEGADFQHAFTPSPICSPARACLLTGRWPTQHGCMSIPGTEIYRPIDDPNQPLLTRLLHDAGYRIAHIGKWHGETPHEPTAYGVDDFIPESQYDSWRRSQGIPDRQRTNAWFGEVDPHITPDQHRIAWGGQLACDHIERYHHSGQPFLVRWDPSEPHLPNMIPAAMADLYPPDTIDPWPSYADTLEGKPWIQAQQRRTWGVDHWTWEQHWAPMVSRYLADITLLDDHVGRVLDTLDRLGIADNTLVIYSTDHGDFCGGHGQVDKHFNMYDDVMRVPLIMRWPGRIEVGSQPHGFVSNELDVAATLCAAAGLDIPETFVGHNLVAQRGAQVPERDHIFAQYMGSQFGLYSQRMVRNADWKYIWNATDTDELYDLNTDPAELTNRIDDPTAAGVVKRLRECLAEWGQSIGDPLFNSFTLSQLRPRT
ncbi:MAG: sulfatase-like hydrolase/transferase [Planctomycetota bacterium]